ncbi:MAG: hypothetical protein KGQ94_12225, partial [Alphaproteobacteria bacterium]|nr:hypothetical protein [Alphaproteobacteria bacterium]
RTLANCERIMKPLCTRPMMREAYGMAGDLHDAQTLISQLKAGCWRTGLARLRVAPGRRAKERHQRIDIHQPTAANGGCL